MMPVKFAPNPLFKPQWAYSTPDGFHDEMFILGTFTFSLPGSGGVVTQDLPVQCDDDVPYYIRGIMFGGNAANFFIRIRDTYNNPIVGAQPAGNIAGVLSTLVLGVGCWCSQTDGDNAFGFPIEPEVECSPGGSVLFDFLGTSNGTAASVALTSGGTTLTLTAALMGAAGNGATITLVNPAAPNVPLSVAVVGRNVTVTLATDGASALTSTWLDVANIINDTPAAFAVMFATLSGPPFTTVIPAHGLATLAGGLNSSEPITIQGTFIGVKRRPNCV